MRHINEAGLKLIEKFEGFSSAAYKDQGGKLTIGIGHTGPDVKLGTFITHEHAVTLLDHDLEMAEQAVEWGTTVMLTDNQFAAMVSFVFNVGSGTWAKSTLLKKLNLGDYKGAADELLKWDHIHGERVAGLTKRRQAERALFLS